jgi:hypothetical protein
MATYRVYLLWQELNDGRKQARRFSPDQPSRFLGYEQQSVAAKTWLEMHGNPKWPGDAFRFPPTTVPFCVVTD